jgi:lactate dehydrogenase-like 2-hydroxyacid dehydrogenase
MKHGAYIVNTARAKICNRDAIVRALESGQLAGYAGDVWFPHPLPNDYQAASWTMARRVVAKVEFHCGSCFPASASS